MRRLASSKHSGVTPCRYSAPNSSGLALYSLSLHSWVSRSNVAPANVVRVIRLVRLGAEPATMYSSGFDSTGVSTPLIVVLSPFTWWQREHCEMNVDSPVAARLPASGAVYASSWLATHVEKSALFRLTAAIRMRAWLRPQNSVHCPS